MPRVAQYLPPWTRQAARATERQLWQSYPAFFLRNLPRALRPRTFNDKVRRRMLFDRRPILATYADKVAARDHVRATVGAGYLTEAYQIVTDARAIDWRALPRTYVCKATHGCGGVIVVSDDADPTVALPGPERVGWKRFFIHPDQADPEAITAIVERWLRLRFGWGPGSTHEWQYRDLTPRVLIEELLIGQDGAPVADYKFDVFHGRCRSFRLETGLILGEMTAYRYWPDGTPLEDASSPVAAGAAPEPPTDLAEMVRVAEALGAGIDYARVDLYRPADRIVFGELTLTPTAGRGKRPPALERLFASAW